MTSSRVTAGDFGMVTKKKEYLINPNKTVACSLMRTWMSVLKDKYKASIPAEHPIIFQ